MDLEWILKRVRLVKEESKVLACCCCHTIALSALLSPCGHLFCKDCIDLLLSNNRTANCPVDQEEISYKEFSAKQDQQLKVMQLIVACPNEKKGCAFIGKLYEMKQHLKSCNTCNTSQNSLCPQGCQESINTKDLPFHLQHECPHRYVVCNFCKTPLPFNDFQKHSEDCDKYPVQCQFNCGYVFPRDQIANHSKNCAQQLTKCKFSDMGCNFKGQYPLLQQHEQNANDHLDIFLAENLKTKYALAKMQCDMDELKNENVMLKILLDDNNKVMDMIKKLTDKLCRQFPKLLKRDNSDFKEDIDETESDFITALSEQVEEIRLLVNNIDRDLQSAKASIKQSLQNEIAQLKLVNRKPTPCNGNFVWILKNFTQYLEDAESGKTESVVSNPFYSHEFGYKFCVRVYPNGYGEAKGIQLSIYVQIMESKINSLLSWPVKCNIEINIINPNTGYFNSDSNEAVSMQKPTAHYGETAGSHDFMDLDVLKTDFLFDDALFFKLKVAVIDDEIKILN